MAAPGEAAEATEPAPVPEAGSREAGRGVGGVLVRWLAGLPGRLRASGGRSGPFVSTTPALGTLLFDLETLRSAADVGGWGNAHRMGVALAVVCHLEEGTFETFAEQRVRELVGMLAAARLVVGFNVNRFDYSVLAGYTGVDYRRRLPTLDLLDDLHGRLGFRLGLAHLAQETLGVGKSADGLQSLAWVREGRFDLVEDYCRRDVEVMRDLYLHGRREGWVCYRDRRRDQRLRVRVGW